MQTNSSNKIIQSRRELLEYIGTSKSTLERKTHAGLWVPPFKFGGRNASYLLHETNALITAYANNSTHDAIKALVISLVGERKNLFNREYS